MKLKLQLFAYLSAIRRDDEELKHDGSTPKAQTLPQSANAVNNPTTYSADIGSPPKGVSEEDWNIMHSTFNESDGTAALGDEKNTALGNFKEVAGKTDIIDQSTKDAMNAKFEKPDVVNVADNYLAHQLAAIQKGTTSYSDQLDRAISRILDRDEFSYDANSDQLFQQALASAMNSGKSAMQDTIGQASALTGGYGSTYATSAANQAYNAFIEDAYDNLPEYYQMALQAYQIEGQEMYQMVDMLSAADAREYGRMVDSFNVTSQYRNQAYNEAYTLHQDSITNAYNSANLQLGEHAQLVSNAYNIYSAASNEYENAYAKEYDRWNASVQNATTNAGFANSDWWNQSNQDFTASENQKDRDFQASESQKDRDFTASENAKNRSVRSSGSGGSGGGGGETNTKSPTETQKKNALEAYNNGGETEYFKYIDSLPSNIDLESIDAYVTKYGELPLEDRTYTKTKDTTNWFWGNDNNDVVTDQYGIEHEIGDLPKSIRGALTDLEEGQSYTKK